MTRSVLRDHLRSLHVLLLSYVAAAAGMLAAALYLVFRLRLFVSTSTMLLGSLLLVYGPALLSYTLSSGEQYFLIRWLSGTAGEPHPIYSIIGAAIGDIDPVIVAINLSVGLMYLCIIVGMELVNYLAPARAAATDTALAHWSSQKLQGELRDHRVLGMIILTLALFMLFVSWKENHLGTISAYLSIDSGNATRNLFRSYGGSPEYFYRVVLSAVAPIFVVWGVTTAILRKSWFLLLSSCLLIVLTIVGDIQTLSKAPPAMFVLQLATAAILIFTNRVSWKLLLCGALAVFVVVYASTNLMMIFHDAWTAAMAVYSRVFEAENQSLFENFATFPRVHPHMWGANIHAIALSMGETYTPTYKIVARLWYGTDAVTSPSLFIADAWAGFSYGGVILFSLVAGFVCRSLDLVFLAKGKSVLAIAVLSAALLGIFTLLTTALNTAFLSGGLLLAPVLACAVLAADHLASGKAHQQG